MQRLNQKVIEEATAPGITSQQHDYICAICLDACRRINYRGVGTFEFLYQDDRFDFIEMNTRIQVEHPITELVTGVDIVKEQLLIATGEHLRYNQEYIHIIGHAIECRLNAENPDASFAPSPRYNYSVSCAWRPLVLGLTRISIKRLSGTCQL
jgi:acetyl-CoA carboxylase biotin carboxylase subunit